MTGEAVDALADSTTRCELDLGTQMLTEEAVNVFANSGLKNDGGETISLSFPVVLASQDTVSVLCTTTDPTLGQGQLWAITLSALALDALN